MPDEPTTTTTTTTTTRDPASFYTEPEMIAYNVCNPQSYRPVTVTLDCSLCAAGWPMEYGGAFIQFWGPPCPPNQFPEPSWYWLGTAVRGMALGCPPTYDEQEPDPNTWVGESISTLMGGPKVGGGGGARTILMQGILTQASSTSVVFTLKVKMLTEDKTAWFDCFQTTATLYRLDDCLFCQRGYGFSFGSIDFIPVEANPACCPVDLRYVTISVGTWPYAIGCGEPGVDEPTPTCALYDGEFMYSCMRALFVNNNTKEENGETVPDPLYPAKFVQIGYLGSYGTNPDDPEDTLDCSMTDETKQECECFRDSIYRATQYETKGLKYLEIGCPHEDPLEYQSVQLGNGPSGKLLVKNTFGTPH